MIIIIEGPDGSGKTTVAQLLAKSLKGEYVRCPGTTPLGEAVRSVLKDKKEFNLVAMSLAMAGADYDVARHAEDLEKATTLGVVVMDRCMLSNFVYRRANFKMLTAMGKTMMDEEVREAVKAQIVAAELLKMPGAYPEGMTGIGTVRIFLTASSSVLDRRTQERNAKSVGDDDRFDRLKDHVKDCYDECMRTIDGWTEIDTSDMSPDQVVNRIKIVCLGT